MSKSMTNSSTIRPSDAFYAAMQRVAQDKAWKRHQNRVHNMRKRLVAQIEASRDRSPAHTKKLIRKLQKDRNISQSYALKSVPEGTPKSVVRRIAKSSMRADNPEVVRYWHVPRKRGAPRPVCSLPPVLKAKHRRLTDTIVAQLRLHPSIYGASSMAYGENKLLNHDKDAAAGRAAQLISDGWIVAESDIADCFQSFNPDGLYSLTSLNIREEEIRQTLDYRKLRFEYVPRTETGLSSNTPTERSGPRGLLQGSPVSSAILAWVLDSVVRSLPQSDDIELVIAFDNILVAAREEAGLIGARRSLASALQWLPVGPLHLSEPKPLTEDGIIFLGYHIDPHGQLRIPEAKLSKLEGRLASNECHTQDEAFDQVLAVWEFAGGYAAADCRREQLRPYLEEVAYHLSYIDPFRDLIPAMLDHDTLDPRINQALTEARKRRGQQLP